MLGTKNDTANAFQYWFLRLKSTNNLKIKGIMDKDFLSDYYPVYKDLSVSLLNQSAERKSRTMDGEINQSLEQQFSEFGSFSSTRMLNAKEIIERASDLGYSKFQIILLLVKNAFEGHVYLTYNIYPEQLFNLGTTLFLAKPEFMLLNFYEHFSEYMSGIQQSVEHILGWAEDFKADLLDSFILHLIINHAIRFPVSIFSSVDIRSFVGSIISDQQALKKQFEIVLEGERTVGEYEFITRVNQIYSEKFRDFEQQLRIKEDVFTHYQKRLALALNPNIYTEDELDELMYRKLINDKLKSVNYDNASINLGDKARNFASTTIIKIKNNTKILYRSVSKNCVEVHNSASEENRFPELNTVFMTANLIYNEPASTLTEAIFQNIRMLLMLSKVLNFRKSQGFVVSNLTHPVSFITSELDTATEEDLRILRKNLEYKIVGYRLKSMTDYKLKFVMDDVLIEIHKGFLHKQLEFIESQIVQIQKEIREILKSKSQISHYNTSNN